MDQFWKDVGIAFCMGFLLPAVLLGALVSFAVKKAEVQDLTEPIIISESVAKSDALDSQIQIGVLNEAGQTLQMSLSDYLIGVVLAEMPVSFETEALKAQSVVARTYTMRAAEGASKHNGVDVCTDSGCCQGFTDTEQYLQAGGSRKDVELIRQLVCATDGMVLTYDGDLIEATYFSCSGGMTEDAVAVWGADVPYLQSVLSPGEEAAAHYSDVVTYPLNEFCAKLGLSLNGESGQWVSNVAYTNGGGVASITIGGTSFTGTQLRNLLELRSTAFTLEIQEDVVTIQTRGYGHRVGMSQYGADAMAATGSTYAEILLYYYKGTELARYTD